MEKQLFWPHQVGADVLTGNNGDDHKINFEFEWDRPPPGSISQLLFIFWFFAKMWITVRRTYYEQSPIEIIFLGRQIRHS